MILLFNIGGENKIDSMPQIFNLQFTIFNRRVAYAKDKNHNSGSKFDSDNCVRFSLRGCAEA
jgi:hypothetical protein